MFGWMAERAQKRRVIEYLKLHPEDEPVVKAVVVTRFMSLKNARELASSVAGRWMDT